MTIQDWVVDSTSITSIGELVCAVYNFICSESIPQAFTLQIFDNNVYPKKSQPAPLPLYEKPDSIALLKGPPFLQCSVQYSIPCHRYSPVQTRYRFSYVVTLFVSVKPFARV